MFTDFKNLTDLQKFFHSEEVCRQWFEELRWGGNPVCPHCATASKPYKLKDGKNYECSDKNCRSRFSVTVGTIFENTKLPLQKWFFAIYILSSHKKGISSLQLSRDLGITQKSAWFVNHRIREMLASEKPEMLEGIVEVDETYIGGKEHFKHQSPSAKAKRLKGRRSMPKTQGSDKTMVLGLLQRDGKVVNHIVKNANGASLIPIINKQVKKGSTMVTDQLTAYKELPNWGYNHESVNHSQHEYVKGNAYTATIDGYWGLLKRGIYGIYHQVSPKHLHRYCDEFAFRYNSREKKEAQRFEDSITQCANKRLTYRRLINKGL